VAGIGFPSPYLGLFRAQSEHLLAFMPAAQGAVNWPSESDSATALVDPLMLPIQDACIDRILIIHCLEFSRDPRELLHEAWQSLSPGGRIVVVAPNRRGLWARMDTTPFGHGQPFSRSQLTRLLRDTLFTPEHWAEALYMPPLQKQLFLRSAVAWERLGGKLALPFAGIHIIEASKQIYRTVPVRPQRTHSRGLHPALIPSPSARSG
jgi:SAM-dependent methyltransferase